MGVVATDDPYRKFQQGLAMQDAGRHIPAESLGLNALRIAEERSDIRAQANAHRYLGNFYKSPLYFQRAEFFQSQGRFDPTYELSGSHFELAANLWAEMGDDWGVASEMFNLATVDSLQKDKGRACELYAKALGLYAGAKFTGWAHPWNRQYKDFPSMVKAFAQDDGCGLLE